VPLARRLVCTLLAALLLLPSPAWAADSPREKAHLLTKTATVLARDGKYDEAVALYEQAYGLDPDPILLFNLGVVKEKQGDLPAARAYLERYLDVEADRKLKEKGALRLGKVLAALGRVRVEVDAVGAAVAVDGTVRGVTPLPPIDLAAGRHAIVVSREGFEPAERVVDVRGGVETPVLFALVPREAPVAVGSPVTGEPPSESAVALPASPPEGFDPQLPLAGAASAPLSLGTWGWVSTGVGAALLAGGVTLTVLAARDRDAVAGARTEAGVVVSMTQVFAQRLEERANRETAASWALYGVGGAALVAGVTFLVWEHALASWESAPTGAASAFVVPVAGGVLAGVSAGF